MGRKKTDKADGDAGFGLGGIFKGLGDLVEKLGELAEKGEELKKSGELDIGGAGKQLKGVYGFNIRFGLGSEGVKVEPFGNIRKDRATGKAVVEEIREPMVDVFDERDAVLVVAEMPGVGEKDISLELNGDVLVIQAQRKDKKYRKEVLLPRNMAGGRMQTSCNNGVVEIRISV